MSLLDFVRYFYIEFNACLYIWEPSFLFVLSFEITSTWGQYFYKYLPICCRRNLKCNKIHIYLGIVCQSYGSYKLLIPYKKKMISVNSIGKVFHDWIKNLKFNPHVH